MHKPHETWVPSLAMRLILGQMSTVVLDTQKYYLIKFKHWDSNLNIVI